MVAQKKTIDDNLPMSPSSLLWPQTNDTFISWEHGTSVQGCGVLVLWDSDCDTRVRIFKIPDSRLRLKHQKTWTLIPTPGPKCRLRL